MDPQDIKAAEMAERISRKRGHLLWLQVVMFSLWQASFILSRPDGGGGPMRSVDHVRMISWIIWVVVLLALLATGGGWIWSKAVRRLLNDEVSVHFRHEAQRAGFWAAVSGCFTVYALNLVAPLSSADAVHLVLSFAILAAVARYAWLERRAEREA